MITKEQIMLALLPSFASAENTKGVMRALEKIADKLLVDWKEQELPSTGWSLTPKGLDTLLRLLRQDCEDAGFDLISEGNTFVLRMWLFNPEPIAFFPLYQFDNWYKLADAIRVTYADHLGNPNAH